MPATYGSRTARWRGWWAGTTSTSNPGPSRHFSTESPGRHGRDVSRSRRLGGHHCMNEIVITGSTGVIGHRAVRELLAAGHRVTGVTRSARGRDRLASLGAPAAEADVFDEASLRRAFT